jgi:hypothetical protein
MKIQGEKEAGIRRKKVGGTCGLNHPLEGRGGAELSNSSKKVPAFGHGIIGATDDA